jgi:hypothetical protein
MLDGNATDFDKQASGTMLQHRVEVAEANPQVSQHSLNKVLLGEDALTPISC